MRDCETPNCLNDANGKRKFCKTCSGRKYREKYPVKYLYANLKSNAKRRGIDFQITLDEWIIFCAETNYHKLKGMGAEDMTVDRDNPLIGYVYSNLKMITRRENAKKQSRDAKLVLQNFKSGVLPGEVPF